MGRRTLLLIAACTSLVAVAAVSSAGADPIPITVTPTPSGPFDFGPVVEGSPSTPQTYQVQNTGTSAITLGQLTQGGTNPSSFPISADGCSNLVMNPGDTCQFTVTFTPPSGAGDRGTQTAALDIGDTGGDTPQEIDFTGTAVAQQIGVPASTDFGSVQVGSTQAESVQVQNTGTAGVLHVQPPTAGGDYSIVSNGTTCNGTGTGVALNPGDTCNINVLFKPTVVGSDPGTLQIASDDPDTPNAQVSLTGTGTQGAISFSPAGGLSFTQPVGTTSAPAPLTITNSGTATVTFANTTPFSIVGTNKGNFAIANNTCGTTLAAGNSCEVDITFTTTVLPQRTASLQVRDNLPGSPQLAALSGTGVQAGPITIVPSSNPFGSQLEGTSSAPQTFQVTNNGGASLTFGNAANTFSFTGNNPTDFSVSNDSCSSQTLPAGGSCTFDVTFTPPLAAGARGARSATLAVAGSFAGSPATVKLTGTATAPAVSAPSTVPFGNVPIGGTPGQQTATVTNNGTGTLQIGTVTLPTGAPFSIMTDGCSNSALTAGQSCSVVVQFQPTSTGAASGTLQIPQTGDPDSPATVSVSLTGTGTQVGPVTLVPTGPIDFGSVLEGKTSSPTLFTVTNTGTAALTGISLGLSGSGQSNFQITNDTCTGAQVNAGKTCTFKASFAPMSGAGIRGAQSASLTVSGPANASGLPQSVALSGTATAPTITVPSSYDFGDVPVGQTASHTFTVKNTGSGTLDVHQQKVTSPGFQVTNDACGGTSGTGLLTAGQSCTITVEFDSSEAGTASGTLSVPNNDPDAAHPILVTLSGNGTVPGPVVISGGSGTFGSQVEGTTSSAQTFTVTNTGTAPVPLGPPPVVSLGGASPGSFTLSGDTCDSLTQLGPSKSCVFKIQFSPPVAAGTRGLQNASVTVTGGADLPQTVPLSGTATAPTLSVNPTSLTFPNTLVGSSSNQSLTVKNAGTGTLTVSAPHTSGPFSVVTNGCASGVSGSQTCTITVAFTPTSPAPATGTLTFSDTDPDSSGSVPLSGTGTRVGPVTVSGSGTFGSVLEGSSSSPQTVTVKNAGNAALSGLTEALSGPSKGSYSIGNNQCGTTLAGGANCTFTVTFSPPVAAQTRGSQTATLTVNGSNDSADLPTNLSLTGNATAPQINAPGSVTFGNVPVGTTAKQTVTVGNSAQGALTIGAVSSMGTGFSVSNNGCAGASLTGAQTCSITVAYQSTVAGPATGALQITSNDPDQSGPFAVTLTATGTQPAVSITGNAAFSTQLGTTSAPQAITVHNTGAAPLIITNVTIGGTNPTAFAKPTDGCNGQTVAAGGTCVINVTFTASDSSPKTATLSITDNAPGSPHAQALTGTALVPGISITPGSETFSQTQIGAKSATRTVTIKDTGTAPLTIGTITLGGSAPTSFLKGTGTGDTCSGKTIAVNGTCTLLLNFVPSSAGSKTADVVIPNNSGPTADLPLAGTGLVPPSPTSMNVAMGCDSAKITWTQPTGQVQFNGIKIIENPSHAPTSPTDGTSMAHTSGYVLQTGMTHFHTFYYAAYDVYSWYNDPTKLVYAKAVQGSGHTGYMCNPRNRDTISDLTPNVTWLSYASGAKYSVLLQTLSGKTIQVVFPSGLNYQFPSSWSYGGSSHSIQSGNTYFVYLYAYTAAKPDGFLIAQAQFTET